MNALKDNPISPSYWGSPSLKKKISTQGRAAKNLIKLQKAYKEASQGGGSSSTTPQLIDAANTLAGDIAIVKSDGSKVFYRGYDDSVEGTPIGVVIIPASHDTEGKSTIMSRCNMSTESATGSLKIYDSSTFLKWSNNTEKVISSKGAFETIQTFDWDGGSSTSESEMAAAGTDEPNFWKQFKQLGGYNESNGLHYLLGAFEGGEYQNMGISMPAYSPYLIDGSKNPDFPTDKMYALDGKERTLEIVTKDKDAVAAKICNEFYTEGTSAGDWWLPSVGELIYLAARLSEINKALYTLGEKAITAPGLNYTYSTGGWALWSSTEYSNDLSWFLYCGCGEYDCGCGLTHNFKADSTYGYRVRAICKV